MVSAAHYYRVTITTCVPADPESKDGSEATVRIAKADLVPTDANLLGGYASWGELEVACVEAMDRFNTRVHVLCAERPVDRLETERGLLHPIPAELHTVAFGETRAVPWSGTFSFRGVRYSVPHRLMGKRVWVRDDGAELVAVAEDAQGTVEVARHPLLGRGQSSIRDDHYPPRRPDPPAPGDQPVRRRVPQDRGGCPGLACGARRPRGAEDRDPDGGGGGPGQAQPHSRGRPGARSCRGGGTLRFGRLGLDPRDARTEPTRPPGAASLQPGTGAWSVLNGRGEPR